MKIAKILNIIAVTCFMVSILIFNALLIYLSIGFLVASMIYWRVIANQDKKNEDDQS